MLRPKIERRGADFVCLGGNYSFALYLSHFTTGTLTQNSGTLLRNPGIIQRNDGILSTEYSRSCTWNNNSLDIDFLFELSELRYDSTSTIFCTLYKQEEWLMRLGGGARAESIIERYSHNVIRIEIGDENMRDIFGSRNTTI